MSTSTLPPTVMLMPTSPGYTRAATTAIKKGIRALVPIMPYCADRIVASVDHVGAAHRAAIIYHPVAGVILAGGPVDEDRSAADSGCVTGTALVVWEDGRLERLIYSGFWKREHGEYHRTWRSEAAPVTLADAVHEWPLPACLRKAKDRAISGACSSCCPEDLKADVLRLAHSVPPWARASSRRR